MITMEDVHTWIFESMYKPGYRLEVREWPFVSYGNPIIEVVYHARDSHRPHDQNAIVEIHRRLNMPSLSYFESHRQFCEWLRAELIGMEAHETDEWFRVRGELFHDPHQQTYSTADEPPEIDLLQFKQPPPRLADEDHP